MKKVIVFVVVLSLCFCLAACNAPREEAEKQPIEWTPVYNEHNTCGLQANMSHPEGTTKRELTEAEIASVVPASLCSEMEIDGYVYFLADKSLYYMVLQMTQGETTVTVHLGEDVRWGGCCISVADLGYAKETCHCGGVEYALYRDVERPQNGMLLGCGKLNETPFLVRMKVRELSQEQPVFEHILEVFARYKADSLNLEPIKP